MNKNKQCLHASSSIYDTMFYCPTAPSYVCSWDSGIGFCHVSVHCPKAPPYQLQVCSRIACHWSDKPYGSHHKRTLYDLAPVRGIVSDCATFSDSGGWHAKLNKWPWRPGIATTTRRNVFEVCHAPFLKHWSAHTRAYGHAICHAASC